MYAKLDYKYRQTDVGCQQLNNSTAETHAEIIFNNLLKVKEERMSEQGVGHDG